MQRIHNGLGKEKRIRTALAEYRNITLGDLLEGHRAPCLRGKSATFFSRVLGCY